MAAFNKFNTTRTIGGNCGCYITRLPDDFNVYNTGFTLYACPTEEVEDTRKLIGNNNETCIEEMPIRGGVLFIKNRIKY